MKAARYSRKRRVPQYTAVLTPEAEEARAARGHVLAARSRGKSLRPHQRKHRPRTLLLQKALAVPFDEYGFRVQPEHIGRPVWVLPRRPERQQLRNAPMTLSHAVVIDVDGRIHWPTPRYALQGSLELTGELRQITIARRGLPHSQIAMRPLRVGAQRRRRADGTPRGMAALVLIGDWLRSAGFEVGDAVQRTLVRPGVILLRVQRQETARFLECVS